VRKYIEVTDDAEITLESSRNPVLQGLYWLISSAIVLFDGSYVGTDPPMDLVVRDREGHRVLYRKGPLHGADAVSEAQEAARVIRVVGVQGYVAREAP
jgi:hypothetical protein